MPGGFQYCYSVSYVYSIVKPEVRREAERPPENQRQSAEQSGPAARQHEPGPATRRLGRRGSFYAGAIPLLARRTLKGQDNSDEPGR